METRRPLRIRQACEEMRRRFPELVQRHKDLAASVTTVLNRLVDYAEANTYFDDAGQRVWAWVSDDAAAAPSIVQSEATEIVSAPGAIAALLSQSEVNFAPVSEA